MVVLGTGPNGLLAAGIWRRLGARVLFFQVCTRNGGRKAPHFHSLLTAVSLAAVCSVADVIVGNLARAVHGPDGNFQLPCSRRCACWQRGTLVCGCPVVTIRTMRRNCAVRRGWLW